MVVPKTMGGQRLMGDHSKIAIPLKVGAAMAAEMMGVCVLTGSLNLVFNKLFNKRLCVQNIHRSIGTFLNKQ